MNSVNMYPNIRPFACVLQVISPWWESAQFMVAKPTTPASKEMNHQNHCHLCLSDSELLLLDDVGEGCADHTADERQAIFLIGGYVAFKHREHAGTPHQTPADVQAFLAPMDRHGLT